MERDIGARLELLWRAPLDSALRDSSSREASSREAPAPVRGGALPRAFGDRYEGGLAIPLRSDGPTVVSNFVTTLDGVVAMRTDGTSGGGDVSGRSDPDRFLMGLLRTLADVVIVAAGTFTADPHHEWTPRRVHPATAAASAEWRAQLGLPPQPTTIVVTGSGQLDPHHPGLNAEDVPVVVVTTERGADELRRRGLADRVRVEIEAGATRVSAHSVVAAAGTAGAGLAVCEGGPQLYAELLSAGLVAESFQTIAPQLAGRSSETPRRSLVEGASLGDRSGQWGRLVTVHLAGSHLFLRYALGD